MAKARDFRVIDGCPCPASVAPMVYLVLRKAGMTAVAIYRGEDAKDILHAHGKHTQGELYNATPAQRIQWNISGQPNKPRRSEHELFSDGVGNPGPPGRPLKEWEQGIDSGLNDQRSKDRVTHAAASLGLKVRHPYRRGAEGHHWCFAEPPWAKNRRQRIKYAAIRAMLPRR